MASSAEKEKEMETGKEDVVCLELPAPPGWRKKLMPKKGGTSKKNEILFIAPTGEEISNKRKLEQYLKANPGGPAASEFNWGSNETPRRSARISEKVKTVPTPEGEPPRKRGRKSSAPKKDEKESETAPEGTEETKDVDVEEAEKSEKENVEGEAGKVDVKENENENKDKTQDAEGKTESTSQEVKHGERANITNIKEGKENAEAVPEKLEGPQDVVEADASGVTHKEKEGFEGATSQGKLEQNVAEAEKGLGFEEQDKTESTSQEVKHGERANITNIKEGKENAEAVPEKLEGPQDVVEADASGVPHKEKEGFEGATSQGKLEQNVAEAEKGLGFEEQDKTESSSQEVKHGECANITNIKDGKENAEAVPEKLEGPLDVVEADASGVPHKEKEGFEGATSQGKLEQNVAEAEKGLGSEEQDKPVIAITEERKDEVEGEEKVKHDTSTTESEGAIKEKESANYKEGQTSTGFDDNNKKEEESIQNGGNGSNAGKVKP